MVDTGSDTLPHYLAAARETTLSLPVLIDGLERQVRSKHGWIEEFSTGRKKRPEHEISTALFNLQVLVQARDMLLEAHKHEQR